MRVILIAAVCVLSAAGADEALQQPSPETSLAKQTFGVETFVRAGAATVAGEIANSPEEWGRGADGIGKRFASAFGKHLIHSTTQFSVATLRHEDLRYFPADKKGFGNRLRHALVSTVVARNTSTGNNTLATGRLSGAFAGGFVSRLWFPDRYHTFSSGMASSGFSLGINAGTNVFREFWPKRRHL